MKRYFTISFAIILVVLLALLVSSVAFAARKKGFDGAWESIDFDGSYQVIVINSDSSNFMLYDFGATSCGVDSSNIPLYSGSLEGTPVIDGYELTVEGKLLCFADNPYYFPEGDPQVFQFYLTYNKNSDTLDGFQVTWSRIEK